MSQIDPKRKYGEQEKHPDKIFIGRIEHGLDFLGYHFGPPVLTMAQKTIAAFVGRAIRLYE